MAGGTNYFVQIVLDKLFTWGLGSQSCQGFFSRSRKKKLLRSLVSTYNTVVNFTILEAIQKVQKIQLQADILNFDFESDGETVNFPQSKFLNPSFDKVDSTSDIPEFTQSEFAELSLASIKKIMLSAKDDAISAINSLGIQTTNFKWKEVMLSSWEERDSASIFVDEERDVSTSKYIDIDEDTEDLLVNEFREGICLRDYSGECEAGNSDSDFVDLVDEHGIEKLILKRSYIWFLQNGGTRISNDRLKRFEVDEKTKN